MNPVQFAIMIVVLLLIVILVSYYFYQENKFKKLVENNFNQASKDVLTESKSLVIDGIDVAKIAPKSVSINAKDTYVKQPIF